MTDMKPIRPVEPDAGAGMGQDSMIERAMARLGDKGFAPPPVPTDLLPASLMPPAMRATAPAPAPAAAPVVPAAAVPAEAAPVATEFANPTAAPAAPAPAAAPAATDAAESREIPVDARPVPAADTHIHVIERERLVNAGIAHPDGGGTAQLEEFRIVKRQLLENTQELARRGGGEAAHRVMMTSPHSGEGKTFCAINLALSFAAERDTEVLLVDFDLARASVMGMFGLPAGPGLMDALVDPAVDVLECIMRTDIPGLSVLPGGPPTRSDAEYLASVHARTVLDRLTAHHPNRLVLFDTPPALAASIPAALAKLVGQVVLVVKADTTAQGAIKDAANLLSGCPNLHLLLNAARFSPSGRRFGSYYGYRG